MTRVAIIGGGPAGLMVARLLARDHADWDVTVFERLEPSDTFGFGVGLTRGLLAAVRAATPELHDELVAACASFRSAAFRLPQGTVELPSSHAGAISRARLLGILLDRARSGGVRVEIGASPSLAEVRRDADLVIGADGMSSASREALAAELGASEELGRGLFIWCGAEIELEGTIFMPVCTAAGTFVAHAYPYADERSTFVIETDADTLSRAGCRSDEFADDGDSDERSLCYLSEAFGELLGGAAFIGNRSRWMHFRTIRCRRWHHGNVVVLGDAAATAHPSLGSGTKLALESAIALAAAMRDLEDGEPPAGRLERFERSVRPQVWRLQDRARRSQLWWESFPARLELSPARIAFAYLSRAGAVSLDDLHEAAPTLAGRAVADFAGVRAGDVPTHDLSDWIVRRPVQWNGYALPERIVGPDWHGSDVELEVNVDDPWGDAGRAVIEELNVRAQDVPTVALTGPRGRAATLDRLALGERIRSELGASVAVGCAQEELGDAVDGLVAGRIDLIKLEEAR